MKNNRQGRTITKMNKLVLVKQMENHNRNTVKEISRG